MMNGVKKLIPLFDARGRRVAALFACVLFAALAASAQSYDENNFSGLRWRSIGTYRAGRVTAVAGIPGRSDVYYIATPGGGVWKTTGGGVTWEPIFDAARISSVGALALAPSNTEIVYVGTGEETEGDGVFKYWDENNLWPEVEGILSEKFVKGESDYMVAPPQFADKSLHYDGYRAGIRRVNGSWKFAYFVNG